MIEPKLSLILVLPGSIMVSQQVAENKPEELTEENKMLLKGYKSKKDNQFKKAEHPAYLLRNSLVSPSLEAAILNAKYVNSVPLYRQEKESERYGVNITRGELARWTILCAEDICRYSMITSPPEKQTIRRSFSRSSKESVSQTGTKFTTGWKGNVRI